MNELSLTVGLMQDTMEVLLAQKHSAFTRDNGMGIDVDKLMRELRAGEKEQRKLAEYQAKEGAAEALRQQRLKEKNGE